MPVTRFPHGISSFGVPQIGSGLIPTTTGSYFFVDSSTGSSGNDGSAPDKALALIDQAINKCTASKGDVIIVMPGHAETVSGTTSIVPDTAGITIVGLGAMNNRPTITFSATGSSIVITGANTVIKNLVFNAGISAVAIGVNVDADDVVLEGCRFYYGGTTGWDFVQAIEIDAFDRTIVRGCVFEAQAATAGAASAISFDDANSLLIEGNHITGDYSLAGIANPSADAAGLNLIIKNNYIYNDDTASASNGIALENACTGIVVGNMIGSLQATNAFDAIDGGSCLNIENYCTNAIDEVSLLAGSSTASA